MRLFKNRILAAQELAKHLAFLKSEHPLVLGLANGGVPVADVVARELEAPLDVLLVEKLFAPSMPEFVVGAVDEHGRISMIQSTSRWHHLTTQQMVEPARLAFQKLQSQRARLRAMLPEADVVGQTVVVVGQGVVSGAKMLGAIASVKDRGAARVVAAAPAGTSKATWQLHESADLVVIPHQPSHVTRIEEFYEDCCDVTDDFVIALIEKWVADRPSPGRGVRTIVTKLTGTRGHALFCELDLPPDATRGSGPYPAVIFLHDFDSNARSPRSLPMSLRLAKREIIGVRLDFTGHGRSEGRPDEATDPQMLADLVEVFKHILQLNEVDRHRIGLVGSGSGAFIALHFAAQMPEIKALVMRGPMCGTDPAAARKVHAPSLIIHAEEDTALEGSVTMLNRELAGAHELIRIPHCSRLFNDPISLEMMVAATVDWMLDHLSIAGKAPTAPPDIHVTPHAKQTTEKA